MVSCASAGPERTRFGSMCIAAGIAERYFHGLAMQRRVGLQSDQAFDRRKRVAKQKSRALDRAEEVAHRGKAAPFEAGEINRRPAGLVDAALNLGRFQTGIDLGFQADQLLGRREIVDTLAKRAVAHGQNEGDEGFRCESATQKTVPRRRVSTQGLRESTEGMSDCRCLERGWLL